MRRIDKGREPSSLVEFRARAGSPPPKLEQAPPGVMDELRAATSRDQGALCCYCQQRIRPETGGMKVEHFVAQSTTLGEPLRLTWSNLHGACVGGEGLPRAQQTCDTRKRALPCSLDPLQIRDEDFSYSASGELRHADAAVQADVDEVLNLNASVLVRARRQALTSVIAERRQADRWTRTALESALADLDPVHGPLPPFAGLRAFWLRRKLRSLP